jgi:hypothetical protein
MQKGREKIEKYSFRILKKFVWNGSARLGKEC